MIVLDSDHVSALMRSGTDAANQLWTRLLTEGLDVPAISVVTLEEQQRGWLAAIRKQHDVARQIVFYDRLIDLHRFYEKWRIVRFDEAAAARFKQLRSAGIRIGTQDLKIASICLAHDAMLVLSNLKDFNHVPGLAVEDWLYQ